MLKFSEIFEFSRENNPKIPILKEFEWFEWFEWFECFEWFEWFEWFGADRTFQLFRKPSRKTVRGVRDAHTKLAELVVRPFDRPRVHFFAARNGFAVVGLPAEIPRGLPRKRTDFRARNRELKIPLDWGLQHLKVGGEGSAPERVEIVCGDCEHFFQDRKRPLRGILVPEPRRGEDGHRLRYDGEPVVLLVNDGQLLPRRLTAQRREANSVFSRSRP